MVKSMSPRDLSKSRSGERIKKRGVQPRLFSVACKVPAKESKPQLVHKASSFQGWEWDVSRVRIQKVFACVFRSYIFEMTPPPSLLKGGRCAEACWNFYLFRSINLIEIDVLLFVFFR